MMAKRAEITCRNWVPDGNGGWRSVENDLSGEEREAFGRKLVERMGGALNEYYSVNPGKIAPMLRRQGVAV